MMLSTASHCIVPSPKMSSSHAAQQHATVLMLHDCRRQALRHTCETYVRGVQVGMNLITTALIALDLSWIQDMIRQNESTGYSSLTRALVLASQAGRMTRLLHVMNLVGVFRVSSSCTNRSAHFNFWGTAVYKAGHHSLGSHRAYGSVPCNLHRAQRSAWWACKTCCCPGTTIG